MKRKYYAMRECEFRLVPFPFLDVVCILLCFLPLHYVQSSDLCTQMNPRPPPPKKSPKHVKKQEKSQRTPKIFESEHYKLLSMFRSCLNGNIATKPPRKNPYTLCQIEGESDITNTFSAFDLVQHENNLKCRDLNL